MVLRQVSLWLQPEQGAAAELDAVIARLAAVHGTPAFPAHLTVLGPVEAAVDAATAGLQQVAQQLQPLDVRFGETRCEHVWHRSLYLAAVPAPALRQAFDVAVRVFDLPGKPVFEPHLSLQYSELPVADKLRLAASLSMELPLTVRFDRVSLWHTAGSDAGRWRLLADRRLPGRGKS
jgi:2'-5' RNA ligase superfamily protein